MSCFEVTAVAKRMVIGFGRGWNVGPMARPAAHGAGRP